MVDTMFSLKQAGAGQGGIPGEKRIFGSWTTEVFNGPDTDTGGTRRRNCQDGTRLGWQARKGTKQWTRNKGLFSRRAGPGRPQCSGPRRERELYTASSVVRTHRGQCGRKKSVFAWLTGSQRSFSGRGCRAVGKSCAPQRSHGEPCLLLRWEPKGTIKSLSLTIEHVLQCKVRGST